MSETKKSKMMSFEEFLDLLEESAKEVEKEKEAKKEKVEEPKEESRPELRVIIKDGLLDELYINGYTLSEVLGILETIKHKLVLDAYEDDDI